MRAMGVVTAALLLGSPSSSSEAPGTLTGGSLTAEQELRVLEAVARYGVREVHAPCQNYGSREAYCLSVRGQDPEVALLKRLADVTPPMLSLTQCQKDGVVGPTPYTIDPVVNIEWLRVVPDSGVQARVSVYCFVSEPTLGWRGSEWVVTSGSGWVGCGPVPANCEW